MATDPFAMPWRPPRSADWDERLKALRHALAGGGPSLNGSDAAIELRRLAGQRLGLMDMVKLNRVAAMAFALRDKLSTLRPVRLALLGNRTLDFLAADLSGAGPARGLLVECAVADYDTVTAVALGQKTWDTGGAVDVAALVLDENAFRHASALLDSADEQRVVAAAVAHLQNLAANLRERLGAPIVVATIPRRPESALTSADGGMAGTSARFIAALNAAIADGGGRGDWIVFDMAGLAAEVGTLTWFDPVRHHESKLPFALELSSLVADRLCALLAALVGRSGRALVMDLDNTLWGGVIGDDGLEGIDLGQGSARGEAFVAMQRLALDLRARGIVLAVCSKNEEEVAKSPFRVHPDMLLKLDHIAVFQANWNDKASNVQAIADALKLGQDALVFVDDNPAERQRVRQELPLVQVLELGEDPAFFPRLIIASRVFDQLTLNADDLARAESYQSGARRAERQSSIGNYEEYLRSLNMKMTVTEFDRLGRARIVQLIAKSNQFNLTTRRYNDRQVEELQADPDVLAWQVRLADVFSDHGMIGVVIVRMQPRVWRIDTWLMSCRVLERGVEQSLMQLLFAKARSAGVDRIVGEYIATDRNKLVERFFDRFGFKERASPDGGNRLYDLDVSALICQPTQIEVILT